MKKNVMMLVMVSILLFELTGNVFGQFIWPGNVIEEWKPQVIEPVVSGYVYTVGASGNWVPISGIPVTLTGETWIGPVSLVVYTTSSGYYEFWNDSNPNFAFSNDQNLSLDINFNGNTGDYNYYYTWDYFNFYFPSWNNNYNAYIYHIN